MDGAAQAKLNTMHRRDYGSSPSAAILSKRAERALREQHSLPSPSGSLSPSCSLPDADAGVAHSQPPATGPPPHLPCSGSGIGSAAAPVSVLASQAWAASRMSSPAEPQHMGQSSYTQITRAASNDSPQLSQAPQLPRKRRRLYSAQDGLQWPGQGSTSHDSQPAAVDTSCNRAPTPSELPHFAGSDGSYGAPATQNASESCQHDSAWSHAQQLQEPGSQAGSEGRLHSAPAPDSNPATPCIYASPPPAPPRPPSPAQSAPTSSQIPLGDHPGSSMPLTGQAPAGLQAHQQQPRQQQQQRAQQDPGKEGRVVVHVDVDCFYCQVERLDDPSLHNVPLAVRQFNAGGFVAVSYEVHPRPVCLRAMHQIAWWGQSFSGRQQPESLRVCCR